MGSHWPHRTVKRSLCSLAVLNGGSICLWYLYVLYMHWYFLIFSYKLTISNGLSLTTLNSEEFTLCSGSFKWGVYHQFYPGKSENLSISLYFLISWPFQMGSHWQHWTAKSSLCALAVSNGGVYCQFYPGKSENLSSFQDLLLLHRALSFLIRNKRPINYMHSTIRKVLVKYCTS